MDYVKHANLVKPPPPRERMTTTANNDVAGRGLRLRWSKLASAKGPDDPSSLGARSSHGLSALPNGRVYAFGGEKVARNPVDAAFFAIDASGAGDEKTKCAWEEVEVKSGKPPPPRVAHAQAVVGGRYIYIFGGRQGVKMDEAPLNDMYCFDTVERAWSAVSVAAGTAPSARSFHRMVAVGTKLYVFGGCAAKGRLNDLHCFETKTKTWMQLPSSKEITGRGGPNFLASADGKRLFVIAGFCGKETSDVHVFDIEKSEWKKLSEGTFPARSVCASCTIPVTSSGLFVLFGGEIDPSSKGHEGAGDFAGDVLVFDGASGKRLEKVKVEGDRPKPRGWGSACAVGKNKFLIYGGLSGNDASPLRLGDTWILEILP